jgi:hypothetical protein
MNDGTIIHADDGNVVHADDRAVRCFVNRCVCRRV